MCNSKFVMTGLICSECGNEDTIMRKSGKLKRSGHIKDLYCYKCKKRTKHTEMTKGCI